MDDHPWQLAAIKAGIYFVAFAVFGRVVVRRKLAAVIALSVVGAILRVMAGFCAAIMVVTLLATLDLPTGFVYPLLAAMRFLLWWGFAGALFEPVRHRPTLIFAAVMTAVNILIDIVTFGLPRVAGLLT